MEIGFDLDLDRSRGFTVSPNGIVTVAKTEDLSMFATNALSSRMRSDNPGKTPPPHQPEQQFTLARHGADMPSREEER